MIIEGRFSKNPAMRRMMPHHRRRTPATSPIPHDMEVRMHRSVDLPRAGRTDAQIGSERPGGTTGTS